MRWNHNPNLLVPAPTPWVLLIKAAGIGGLSAVVVWSAAWGPVQGTAKRASIGDVIAPTTSPGTDRTPKAISRGAVTSVAAGLRPDTVRYYEPSTGRSFTADLRTGTEQVVSDRSLSGFIASRWIPGREHVISSFDRQGTRQYRWYDYATGDVRAIEAADGALAVAPDGRHVAFLDADGNAPGIAVAEPDGTDARTILRTRATDIELTWPRNDLIAMASRRPDRSGLDLTIVGMDGTLVPVLSDREGLEYAWSPDGEKLLFSYFAPGTGVALWYRDGIAGTDTPLHVPTGARKCAWHADRTTITCGVPRTSTLVPDVPSDRTATTDDIVSIDIAGGTRAIRARAATGTLLGVIDPIMSSSDRYLTFTNVFDKRLYSFEF